jgi:hypothetical protein
MSKFEKIVTVDDEEYQIMALETREGMLILQKLTKYLSEPISKSLATFIDSGLDKQIDTQLLSTGITSLFMNISNPEIIDIVETFLKNTFVKNIHTKGFAKLSLDDEHFKCRYIHLAKVIFQCINVNYQDFFLEVKKALSLLQKNGIINQVQMKK